MLDYHVIAALEAMLPNYTGSADNFAALFDNVDAAVVTEWFTLFVAEPPAVRAYGAKGSDKYPAFIVQLQNESPVESPMGDAGKTAAGVSLDQTDVTQTVAIEIWAPTPEKVRVLHVVARAIILGVRRNFLSAGYDRFSYQGADPPSPVEEQLAEQFGVVVRRLSVEARQRVTVPQVAPVGPAKTWFVLASDQDLAGVPGGVVPYEP